MLNYSFGKQHAGDIWQTGFFRHSIVAQFGEKTDHSAQMRIDDLQFELVRDNIFLKYLMVYFRGRFRRGQDILTSKLSRAQRKTT